MKDINKSAVLALISIPITYFGVSNSFALAHGATFLMILLMPGLVVESLVFGDRSMEQVMGIVGYISQYVAYLLLFYAIALFNKSLKNNENE